MARCALVTDCRARRGFPDPLRGRECRASIAGRAATGSSCPIIFNPSNGVSSSAAGRCIDNLRRSLTPIAWFFASGLGWYYMEPFAALIWQIRADLQPVRRADAVADQRHHAAPQRHRRPCPSAIRFWPEIRAANAQVALRIVFIAHSRLHDGGRHRPFALPHLRQPQADAAMAHGRQAQAAAQTTASSAITASCGIAPVLAVFRWLWLSHLRYRRQCLLRRHSLRVALDSVAGHRLVCQPVGGDGRPARSCRTMSFDELRKIARRTWRYFEQFVTAEQQNYPAAGQFPGDAASGRRRAHVADQYRRLSAVGHVGPRFRLDRFRGNHRSPGRDGRDHRPNAREVPRASLQLVSHRHAEDDGAAICLGGRQRQSRRPPDCRLFDVPRSGRKRPPRMCRAISTVSAMSPPFCRRSAGRTAG